MAEELRSGAGATTENSDNAAGIGFEINLADEADKEYPGFKSTTVERQRWYMLGIVGILFFLLNAAVVWLICWAISIDQTFVSAHPELADKRSINGTVFHTLIAATVVQTGAITWAMARFLFPNQPE